MRIRGLPEAPIASAHHFSGWLTPPNNSGELPKTTASIWSGVTSASARASRTASRVSSGKLTSSRFVAQGVCPTPTTATSRIESLHHEDRVGLQERTAVTMRHRPARLRDLSLIRPARQLERRLGCTDQPTGKHRVSAQGTS